MRQSPACFSLLFLVQDSPEDIQIQPADPGGKHHGGQLHQAIRRRCSL